MQLDRRICEAKKSKRERETELREGELSLPWRDLNPRQTFLAREATIDLPDLGVSLRQLQRIEKRPSVGSVRFSLWNQVKEPLIPYLFFS